MTKTKDQKREEELADLMITKVGDVDEATLYLIVKQFISKEIAKAETKMGEALRMEKILIPSQVSDKGWGAGYNQAVKEQNRQIINYIKK